MGRRRAVARRSRPATVSRSRSSRKKTAKAKPPVKGPRKKAEPGGSARRRRVKAAPPAPAPAPAPAPGKKKPAPGRGKAPRPKAPPIRPARVREPSKFFWPFPERGEGKRPARPAWPARPVPPVPPVPPRVPPTFSWPFPEKPKKPKKPKKGVRPPAPPAPPARVPPAAAWPFPERPSKPPKPSKPRKPKPPKAAWPFPEKGKEPPGVPASEVVKLVEFFEKSPKLVAELLDVAPSTVQRWLKTGVPAKWCGRPSHYVKRVRDLFEVARKSIEEEQVFAELMKLAGEAGVLPRPVSQDKERSGPKTQGWMWTRRIQRRLSEEVIQQMAAWMRKLPGARLSGTFPLWHGVVVSSQYALTARHDFGCPPAPGSPRYKTVIMQLGHIKSGDFAIEHEQPTSVYQSQEAMVQEMVECFEALLLDSEIKIFVHAVTVYNYRRRSPQERRERASRERRERKEKEEKRKQK